MARTIDMMVRIGRRMLLPALLAGLAPAGWATPIHALLVGGGPDKESNTAQIEEHLRFVTSLVPASAGRVVLFADGRASSRNLSYTDSSRLSEAQEALDVLLPNDGLGAKVLTRAPMVGATLDGPSRLSAIDRGFRRLAATSGKSSPPVLLYFAGHGSLSNDDRDDKEKTSLYNLWGDESLDPETLLSEIETLPPRVPVTLVMAQCFSGGFGNVLFRKANPNLAFNSRPIIGFFASESDREAAGCGTETNSPLYQDFSSYFFGALSGRDKLGHRVEGADFDGDGQVSCHEAWCYALIHDDSIDTPVCTSLIFLRKYADVADSTIFSTPWRTLMGSATAGERAALEALSGKLNLDGEHRILTAYDRLMFADPIGQPGQIREYRETQDRLNELRLSRLDGLFQRWPELRWRDNNSSYDKAAREAAAELAKDPAGCQALIELRDALDRANETLDEEEALLVRLTDVAENVVRRSYFRAHGDSGTRARFEMIWRAEQEPLGIAQAAR